MNNLIQQVFRLGYGAYCEKYTPSAEQRKAAYAISKCKTGELGYYTYTCTCPKCDYAETRPCSCGNRHCPACQAIPRERWIDERKSEVFDTHQYFHVVMTVPHQLILIFLLNLKLMYSLLHQCSSRAIIDLCKTIHGMGGTPCITQVLHTWGNKLNYHPHIHAIVSGMGLSSLGKLVECKKDYLFPLPMLMKLFRGKFLHHLNELYLSDSLVLPENLKDYLAWKNYLDILYSKEWTPYIKETFNGNGNAIDYLGRYTYRVAISNSRILEVTNTHVTFSAYDYKTNSTENITLTLADFIRKYLMHVLPKGMQKIRSSGLLNNRFKYRNLETLSILLKKKRREAKLKGLNMAETIKLLWNTDITVCPKCNNHTLKLSALPFHQIL